MRSGRKRHKIDIQKQSDESDEFGNKSDEFETVFSAKCDFKITSGIDLVKAGMDSTREFATILMRNDQRLQYDYSVLYNGAIYDIESIRPHNKDRDAILTISRLIR